MQNKQRVSRARKFIGGLSLILALSSIGGCSFNNKNNDITNHNSSYEYEMTDEIDNSIEIETPEQIDTPEIIETPEEDEVLDDIISEDATLENNNQDSNDISTMEIPNIGNYNGYSISDALRLAGYPYNFNYRASLAARLGIENYRGTAEQNILMLKMLKEYANSLGEQLPTDNNGNENTSEEHVFGNEFTRYEKYNDSSHYVITFKECADCGYTLELNRKLENHNITNTYIVHEKENDDGYDEVTYGSCVDCSAVIELSRRYIDKSPVEECDHSNTRTVTKLENERENEHDEVVYEVCNDCGRRKEISRTKVNHSYVDKIVSNDDGTHTHIRTYECSNGRKYSRVLRTENCIYGSIQTRQENVTDDGYYLVKYRECSKCGYEHVISREYISTNECDHTLTHEVIKIENESDETHTYEEVKYEVCNDCGRMEELSRTTKNHSYVDGTITSNNDGTHKYVRTYTRYNGTTYEVTITNNCSYENNPKVIENESDETHTYEEVIYGECDECGNRKVLSRITKNHSFIDEVVNNNNNTHSTIRTYTRSDGTTYTVNLGTEEHNIINIGQQSYRDIGNGQHQIVTDQKCTDCSYVKQNVVISTENCVSDGIWHTDNVNGSLIDYQICIHCNQNINQKAHTNHVFVGDWVQSSREGYHQNTCSACGEVIYEACNMEDVYENGILVGKKCSTCGRSETIGVVEHVHNYGTNVIVVTIDGVLYDVHECLNYDDTCDAKYEIIGVHQHNFVYEGYRDNGDGTCSPANGKCSGCEEISPGVAQSHNYVYCNIDDYGEAGCYFHTECEHCRAEGPEGYSPISLREGDPYVSTNSLSLSPSSSYSMREVNNESYSIDDYSESMEDDEETDVIEEIEEIDDVEEIEVVNEDYSETTEEDEELFEDVEDNNEEYDVAGVEFEEDVKKLELK